MATSGSRFKAAQLNLADDAGLWALVMQSREFLGDGDAGFACTSRSTRVFAGQIAIDPLRTRGGDTGVYVGTGRSHPQQLAHCRLQQLCPDAGHFYDDAFGGNVDWSLSDALTHGWAGDG